MITGFSHFITNKKIEKTSKKACFLSQFVRKAYNPILISHSHKLHKLTQMKLSWA